MKHRKRKELPKKEEEVVSAIKPDFLSTFRQAKADIQDERAKTKGIDPEDAALYEMSQLRGWQIAKRIGRSLISELDDIVRSSIDRGATMQDIGLMTFVKEEVKSKLESFFTRIDGTKEVIERKEG
jgi:hypothetical protein